MAYFAEAYMCYKAAQSLEMYLLSAPLPHTECCGITIANALYTSQFCTQPSNKIIINQAFF